MITLAEILGIALEVFDDIPPEQFARFTERLRAAFEGAADEPARLATPFTPALDELREELMTEARGGRVSSPTAATDRPPALPKTPTGDDDA